MLAWQGDLHETRRLKSSPSTGGVTQISESARLSKAHQAPITISICWNRQGFSRRHWRVLRWAVGLVSSGSLPE